MRGARAKAGAPPPLRPPARHNAGPSRPGRARHLSQSFFTIVRGDIDRADRSLVVGGEARCWVRLHIAGKYVFVNPDLALTRASGLVVAKRRLRALAPMSDVVAGVIQRDGRPQLAWMRVGGQDHFVPYDPLAQWRWAITLALVAAVAIALALGMLRYADTALPAPGELVSLLLMLAGTVVGIGGLGAGFFAVLALLPWPGRAQWQAWRAWRRDRAARA